jgi:hypothetical protein
VKFSWTDIPAFLAVAVAAYIHFGWVDALGIVGALYLLAPYYVTGTIATQGVIR